MADVGLRGRVIFGAAWLASGRFAQAMVRLAVLATLSRLLLPAELGLASAAMVVLAFLRFFTRSGIAPAIVQREDLSETHIRVGFTMAVTLGTTLGGLLYLYAVPIGEATFALDGLGSVLAAVAVMMPIQSFGVVAMALLERRLEFSSIVKVEFAAYLAYAVFGITLASQGYGVWSLILGSLAEATMRTILCAFVVRHPMRPSLDPDCVRELLYFSSGFTTAGVGNFAAGNGDNWVVGRFLGGESLGFYKYAFELTTMISTLIAGVLDNVLFPAMASVQSDKERLGAVYLSGVALVSIILYPASSVLIVLAPSIIEVILGPGWEATVAPFRILALVLILRGTYKVSDSVARATGAVFRRAWRQWLFAAVVIFGGMSMSGFGIVGIAAATAVATATNALLMAQLSAYVVGLDVKSIVAAHVGALPSAAVCCLAGLIGLRFSEGFALPAFAELMAVGLLQGVSLLVAALAAPRLILGGHGVVAVETVREQVAKPFPGLADHRLARRLSGS